MDGNSSIINHTISEVYPTKPDLVPLRKKDGIKGLLSIALYFAIGALFLQNYFLAFILLAIIVLHEMGHLITMRHFDYQDTSMMFIPLVGAYVSGRKREISQKQSAFVLLAGPMPGIIFGVLLLLINTTFTVPSIWGVSLQLIGELFIWLNVFNLLPLYPLDGGQLLNRLYFNENDWVEKVLSVLTAATFVFLAFYFTFAFLILGLLTLSKIRKNKYNKNLDKAILESGVDIDKDYVELTDKEYWILRNSVIQFTDANTKPFNNIPENYDDSEQNTAHLVDQILQRNLIQDASIKDKISIALLWASALVLPWIINNSILFNFIKKIIFRNH